MNAYGRPVDGPKLANEFVLHNIDDPNEVITLFELDSVQQLPKLRVSSTLKVRIGLRSFNNL